MSDTMKVQPFELLLRWILQELKENDSVFGIHRSLFYIPSASSPYTTHDMFGHHFLATPFGPAAGPHTQLTQNIVAAWLSGGRFIELKTVQTMDELEIPRPCIDMEDEGYNVEWSQELKLGQSASEYTKAWVLIHILRRLLGVEGTVPFGTIFNMSVGYNLEGILRPPMQRFMDQMEDASEEISQIRNTLQKSFPQFADIEIPPRLTDSVTLSTMHGCPPKEIDQIARYLLENRRLNTIVKLNPTLLGKEAILNILHEKLGFHEIHIPDSVFDHDLQYARALELIASLKRTAAKRGLFFGVKLSNTLAMSNHKDSLPGDEVYMSGRPLFPITINLLRKLAEDFDGDLNVSFSAGADALNVTTILAAGARPVTVASDLLKPGGYSRLLQYLENLEAEMLARGASSLDELAQDRLSTLERVAQDALRDPRYAKSYHPYGLPKVESELGLFDCIRAPCVHQCAVLQDVPEYAWLISEGDYNRALEVILARNPLPGVTGYVCTHLCQTRCTRNNYDQPVLIRDLKRFATEHGSVARPTPEGSHYRVAVIGSGPSGLAAASFLALNGVHVTIFEAREMPGGMLAIAPHFRLPPSVVQADIERITSMGVEIRLGHRITGPPQKLLDDGYDAVYVACGFQRDAQLNIKGIDGEGVFTALRLLEQVARGESPRLGARVLVIGGGNTAMDAARTAQRLTGQPSTIVYRRSRAEMPAEEEELRVLLDEGNLLLELVSPSRVILRNGRVVALECVRNELAGIGPDGRRRSVRIEGTEFEVEADSIILAIGQRPDLAFLDGSGVTFGADGTIVPDPATGQVTAGVYAGGDVTRGPAIIVEACADGRRAAEAMCRRFGIQSEELPVRSPVLTQDQINQLRRARARRTNQHQPELLPVALRSGFGLVEQTLADSAARAEAARCLQCSTVCDKCVEVCPNRANHTYLVSPVELTLPLLSCRNGAIEIVGEETFTVEQSRQIIHVDDFCNECGNCATFCVHDGKPYVEKPRLFLQECDYHLEYDNAFHIEGSTIRRRRCGGESRLSVTQDAVVYENAHLRIGLTPELQVRDMALVEAFEGTASLVDAIEMASILRGITSSAAFLLR